MTSPEEVAREIVDDICARRQVLTIYSVDDPDRCFRFEPEAISLIATALRSAREHGKADGLEEAAGIADQCDRSDCRADRESRMVVVSRNQGGEPTVWCDPCIEPLVRALNDAGVKTVASCCGHKVRPGFIALADGRELVIAPDFDTARRIDQMFRPLFTQDELAAAIRFRKHTQGAG